MADETPALSVEEAREALWALFPEGWNVAQSAAVDDLEDAIRAESAAALSATNRELSALSSDKQALMTATTHWRERAEKAEAELKRRDDADRINALAATEEEA